MQYKITHPSDLLKNNGELMQKGYAESLILNYNRKRTANKCKLKEWDYYLIYCEDFAVALTAAKSSFFGMFSASFIDFHNKTEKTKTIVAGVPFRKLNMPASSESGDICFRNKNVSVSFHHCGSTRQLNMSMNNFDGSAMFEANLELSEPPQHSMVIATPFQENNKLFYYNQKIIGMKASGTVSYKNKRYTMDKLNSFGLLDWGRGIWPRHATWYWGAGQGLVNDSVFGFNLGYGFGDTTAATENMLFYKGRATKLEDITFHIPKNEQNEYDYMKPWTVTSSDKRFEMEFTPILDRSAFTSSPLIATNQHQVFGRFNGKAVLDNGIVIELENFLGFIERVQNKW